MMTEPALPPGETLLLTLRLAGSVPRRLAGELLGQRVAAQEAARSAPTEAAAQAAHRQADKRFFADFDALLDAATVGPNYLEKEKLAEAVAGELLMLEELGFRVVCFAVVPNHVHAVLHRPASSGLSLYKALELLHQRTAALARRHLRGQLPFEADFWQTGFHEYAVADAPELVRIRQYVLAHAQRLRLPERFHDWPYLYLGAA